MFKGRKSGVGFLLVAVVCGLVAAVMVGWLLLSYTRTVDVLVVNKDIDPYEQLDSTMVSTVSMVAAAVPPDALRDVDDVNGKYIRFGLAKESVVRKAHLLDGVQGGPLASILSNSEEPQKRAFAIPLNSVTSIGGAISKEDRIDLIACLPIGVGGARESAAKIIARNVRVVDIVGGAEGDKDKLIIIVVTPEQVEELVFLLENGKVYTALNPYDADVGATVTDGFYDVDKFMMRHLHSPEVLVSESDEETSEKGNVSATVGDEEDEDGEVD